MNNQPDTFAPIAQGVSGDRSHVARFERDTALVYDLRATINGERLYFIIKLEPAKHQAFLDMLNTEAGGILEEYGEILFCGWNEPPDDRKAYLRERFGMYSDS